MEFHLILQGKVGEERPEVGTLLPVPQQQCHPALSSWAQLWDALRPRSFTPGEGPQTPAWGLFPLAQPL